jgi:nicotinate-nucleotide adenylyltransferase
MLKLAVRDNPWFLVDDCEILRGGASYSIETVFELKRRHALEGKPGFLIGDDLLKGFPAWKEADRLAGETDLIVARRTSADLLSFSYPHSTALNAIFSVSSSEIRRRIGKAKNVRYLLPDAVIDYIAAHGLYA